MQLLWLAARNHVTTTTTTVLRPIFRNCPGELVPEENFWTLWCKGRLTETDTPTIRLGTTPSGLTSAHLYHPPFLQAGCPSCRPTNSVKALKDARNHVSCNLKLSNSGEQCGSSWLVSLVNQRQTQLRTQLTISANGYSWWWRHVIITRARRRDRRQRVTARSSKRISICRLRVVVLCDAQQRRGCRATQWYNYQHRTNYNSFSIMQLASSTLTRLDHGRLHHINNGANAPWKK